MAGFRINFVKASDDRVSQSNLLYRLYFSREPNINTVEECETNGQLVAEVLDVESFLLTGLTPGNDYYFNIVVRDLAGNKSAYSMGFEIAPDPVLSSLQIIDDNFFMHSGQSRTIQYIIDVQDTQETGVTWESSDSDIATIDEEGRITGISEGVVEITVRSVLDPDFFDTVLVGVDTYTFGSFSQTRNFTTINE